MELKRHASYWMNWKRWEHLNGRDRVLNSKNQNLIRLIITILILIISILSGSEETSLWMGYDGFQ